MVDHKVIAKKLEAAIPFFRVKFSLHWVYTFYDYKFYVLHYIIFDADLFWGVILIDIFLKLLKI